MAEIVTSRVGPPQATLVRARTVRGRTVTLALVVEVWGAGSDRAELEGRLARGLAQTFETTQGSLTARLRAALDRGHQWLASQAPAGADPLGAGVSLLVLAEGEALLAQVGPAVAFGPPAAPQAAAATPATAGTSPVPAPERHPAHSPWLKRGLTSLGPDPSWPPLGLGTAPGVHWAAWPTQPGGRCLLAATACAEALTREAVADLFARPAAELASALAAALPADGAAVLVAQRVPAGPKAPGPPGRPSGAGPAEKADPAVPGAPAPGARAAQPAPTYPRAGAPPPAPARPRPAWATQAYWRIVAARLARGGARALTAVLPSRPVSGADSYRVERARLLAAAVLALPALVLVLALAYGRKHAGLLATSPAGALEQPPLAGPTVEVSDDPAARIVRLAGVTPLAPLPGESGDERVVVVSAGTPYVLNRTRNQVDRIAGGEAVPVLRRGQAVQEMPVANLEDLLVVSGGAAGERVLALDAAGNLWQVDGTAAAAVPRSETPVWQAVSHAAGWQGQLYAVDRAVGQVWRYAPAGDGFPTAGVSWMVEASPWPYVVDVAINGDIYLLERDGTIRKYAGGAELPFQLAAVPEGFTRGQSLYAGANELVLTDPVNGRLLAFKPDGSYRAQLLFPPQAEASAAGGTGRIPDLHGAWWDEANTALYVAAGTWLYRAPYASGQ